MGAGGKKKKKKIQSTDISKSHNCQLARIIRKRLALMGIKNGVKVVFSSEEKDKNAVRLEDSKNKRSTVGTISYMPPIFGCFISSVVIRDFVS